MSNEREFKSLIHGEFVRDETYELYLKIWLNYRRITEAIDGHIEIPYSHADYRQVKKAAIKGNHYLFEALKSNCLNLLDLQNDPKWQRAKLESMRLSELYSKKELKHIIKSLKVNQ